MLHQRLQRKLKKLQGLPSDGSYGGTIDCKLLSSYKCKALLSVTVDPRAIDFADAVAELLAVALL